MFLCQVLLASSLATLSVARGGVAGAVYKYYHLAQGALINLHLPRS